MSGEKSTLGAAICEAGVAGRVAKWSNKTVVISCNGELGMVKNLSTEEAAKRLRSAQDIIGVVPADNPAVSVALMAVNEALARCIHAVELIETYEDEINARGRRPR